MTEHNLFYYPYIPFSKIQFLLLKAVVMYLDRLVILDSVGASWDTIGVDHYNHKEAL